MMVRGLLLVVGLLLSISGLVAITAGASNTISGPDAALAGLWAVAIGGFLMIVAVLERTRYRSQAAEQANDPIGPGGGETTGPVDPRFQPTDEVFLDPTTGLKMRVLVDGRTGERRYVAEG
jgi:hypothetical protein